MWLLTTRGFFSVVEDRDDPTRVLVRTRVGSDLERLNELLPHVVPARTPDADYPWRARVDRREWAYAVGMMIAELDYPNFKDAVAERQGSRRATVYGHVWAVLRRLERG